MKTPPLLLLVVLAWLVATVSGTWAMMSKASTPGDSGAPPANWPAASLLPRTAGRATLVFFVHPRCPCSRASIGELALVMAHGAGQLETQAVFVDPAGMDAAWAKTDLWAAAAAIPGVEVKHDTGGREAQTFRAATSGDALLYAADGRLLFHGGITLARGHAGDNPGRSAIERALHHTAAATAATTPVFGCALFGGTTRGKPCKR